MGLTKTGDFTESQNEIASICKAMGHPARIAIIEHLIATNSCITGELVDVLPLSQATVSQHLKELKNAGIIQGTISGTSVNYCINSENWNKIASTLSLMLRSYNPSCC
jgi:DNA-binding transcriptional ArsR family regulator